MLALHKPGRFAHHNNHDGFRQYPHHNQDNSFSAAFLNSITLGIEEYRQRQDAGGHKFSTPASTYQACEWRCLIESNLSHHQVVFPTSHYCQLCSVFG
jgi:hypothetical protein